ncbi:MAG: acyltransferase [Coriobacteriia bacterium]|nr:acyltransferase [Coriobacteriia bacterium]
MTQQERAPHLEKERRVGRRPLTHYTWLSLLRAYGVILVLVYHFFPWLMPGGFIGVDVFLVFSGYLITSLLISEFKNKGKVRLLAFYKRRFRRLFPALVLLLLVVLPLTLTIPEDFRADMARQVAAVLSWTTNLYEIATGGSYANTLLPHLFVHTWTLSVEMHYYLIWGLFLTFALPYFAATTPDGRKTIASSRRAIALLAIAMALVSYVIMQLLLIGADDPSVAYYSTISRSFPILIGSALGAFAGFGRTRLVVFFEKLKPALAVALAALSLLGIALLAVFLPFENILVYRMGILLTALLVGVVILVGRGAQDRLQRWKEPKVLQYISDRSYSIYLFHWPLMIIVLEWARSLFGRVIPGLDTVYVAAALLALALTFLAAHLSYRFVELPFSKRRGARGASPSQDSDTVVITEPAASSAITTSTISAAASTVMGKVALAILVIALASGAAWAITTAPHRSSIEMDYQLGLLDIDLKQMEASRQALVHTSAGGSMDGEPRLMVRPETITVIGDSVTIFPAEELTRLTGAFVDAEVSRAMVHGIGIMQDMQKNRTLGEYVVIALATNAHADSFESAVTLCEELPPGHRLIFVTAHGSAYMEALNVELRTLPGRYPFVTIADWTEAISGQEYLLAADGYHLSGQEAIDIYVNVVVEAIEEAADKPVR